MKGRDQLTQVRGWFVIGNTVLIAACLIATELIAIGRRYGAAVDFASDRCMLGLLVQAVAKAHRRMTRGRFVAEIYWNWLSIALQPRPTAFVLTCVWTSRQRARRPPLQLFDLVCSRHQI
jgi:hypothetical protein|tara:strand:- start:220 stop:579 length:360 start_codon:yes stop_codon:yes gene_type:complete